MAETAEAGKVYEIEIVEPSDEGAFGIAYIGDAVVTVPNARVGDRLKIKVISVVTNYWTNRGEVYFEKVT
jgi:predicted RNA-binding protein with TRAM domain